MYVFYSLFWLIQLYSRSLRSQVNPSDPILTFFWFYFTHFMKHLEFWKAEHIGQWTVAPCRRTTVTARAPFLTHVEDQMCVEVQLCISSHLQKLSIWDLRPHIWSALNKTLNLSQSSGWNWKRSLRTILFSCTIFVRWNMPSDQLWRKGIGLFTSRIGRELASAAYLCLRRAWARIRSMRTRSEERSWRRTRLISHIRICWKSHVKRGRTAGKLQIDEDLLIMALFSLSLTL